MPTPVQYPRCSKCRALQPPTIRELPDMDSEELIQSLAEAIDELIGEWPSHRGGEDGCECPYCEYVRDVRKVGC